MKQVFSLPDIRCINCVQPIENTIKELQEQHRIAIEQYHIDVVDKTLTITSSVDEASFQQLCQTICDELDDIGTECQMIADVDTAEPDESCKDSDPITDVNVKEPLSFYKRLLRSHRVLGGIGVLFGLGLLISSFFALSLPFLASVLIAGVSITLTLLLGAESYKEAFKSFVKTRTLTMDTLFSISTLTVITVSIASFFFPVLPQMFDAGLLIFGFRHIGQAIEASIKQSMGLSAKFQDRTPKYVTVKTKDGYQRQKIGTVNIGDTILVLKNEMIPLNGTLISREALIYKKIEKGCAPAQIITKGDRLLAGMELAQDSQPIEMNVTAKVKDSYLFQLDEQIAKATAEKSAYETFANKALQYFIPTVLLLAGLSAAVVGYFFSPLMAIECAAAVLVSACPCTLGLITPIAVKIGLNKAVEHEVLFKSGATLQDAASIDTVVFDLNGTLTLGALSVRHCQVLPEAGLSRNELLTYFASLEQNASHPVAKAIQQYVDKNHIRLPEDFVATQIDKSSHSGIRGQIQGQFFTLGNSDMMKRFGVSLEAFHNLNVQAGETVIYLARAQQVIGYMIIHDPLRPNARESIAALKASGKDVFICTGADEHTANRYAELLGVDFANVRADFVAGEVMSHQDALQMNKKSFINSLQNKGKRVAMIGDSGNDAVAIAASDFSIAIKSNLADSVTEGRAGAVVLSDSLRPVINAFVIAKDSVRNIKQNLVFSLAYNLVMLVTAGGLPLAFGLSLSPAIAAGLMIVQSSLILLNALRFRRQRVPSFETNGQLTTQNKPMSPQLLQASLPPIVNKDCKKSFEETAHQDGFLKASKKASEENTLTNEESQALSI